MIHVELDKVQEHFKKFHMLEILQVNSGIISTLADGPRQIPHLLDRFLRLVLSPDILPNQGAFKSTS